MNDIEQRAIIALSNGDIAGLESLVAIYQLKAVRAAFGIVGNREAAEDVVAAAFITVFDRIGTFNPARPFAPWFYRIVVNGALKAIRNNNRFEPTIGEDAGHIFHLTDSAPGPAESAEFRELQLLLLNAIYELPPNQRAAIVLRYYLDMDEASVAEALGCPIGTVKWRLHSARQKLRLSLIPHALVDGI